MIQGLAGYRIIERLYRSPRSVIERAIRIRDGALVVVKRSAGSVVAAEALRRLQHEYDLLEAVSGQGVVQAYEIVRDGSQVALIIENFGESLATCMQQARFSIAEALAIGRDTAGALGRVHAAGIVHKDINPHNIVYDQATRGVKLIDFDIATRHRSIQLELVPANVLEGTLHYMAPEQTGRLNRHVDSRSDLYSLGVTLYELLTGRRPFAGDDALATVHAHLATQPSRIDRIDPAIPSMVADIVARLLAKAPDHRYQTAGGLQADLERCLELLRASSERGSGTIEPFALGASDMSTRFEFPERLYGRDVEIRALLDAFDRTTRGVVETVLVAGYSGVGKSSVVREIYAPVTAQRGYLAAGKFQQLHRDVPYSAVIAALDELLAQVLVEADSSLARWRDEIIEAVGADGPLVVTVLPAIVRLIGPQPGTTSDPDPAQRLAAALARLVQRFAQPAHPLVLFLDDMQWADSASLQLLTLLATTEQTQSLLLIEAYRDNEVDPAHPFANALREHEKRGARLTRITLAPLGLAETTDLVSDVLRLPMAAVAEVAGVIWRKTEGNPFFLRQFLQTLHDDGLLAFDPVARGFTFDISTIDNAGITENVADLLARKLGKLSPSTREVLTTAAAIGNRFDIATLGTVAERSVVAVHQSLAPALDAGMIVPLGSPTCIASDATSAIVGPTRYAFQHDRVQQAAYELVPPEVRTRMHAAIGRSLLASCAPDLLDERLFDIVHHLNSGLVHVVDPGERARLVALDLVAARRARRAGAFDVAAGMLRSAAQLVTWADHYTTCFDVHQELAQVLAFAGLPDEARATVHRGIAHATPRDRATLETIDTRICIQVAKMVDAVACARRAAELLGIVLPEEPAELGRQIEAEIGVIMAAMAASPIERWIDLPPMTDRDKLAAMELFVCCIPAAYQIEPPLLVLISAKLVTLSLEHGNCGMTAPGCVSFSLVLWVLGHYDAGYRFAQLGVDLNRRLGAQATEPFVDFLFAAFSAPWQRPLDASIKSLRRTIERGVECGDVAHSGYAAMFLVAYRQIKGDPLREVLDDAQRFRKLAIRLGLPEIEAWLRLFPRHLRIWTDDAPTDGELDPEAMERDVVAAGGSGSVLAMLRSLTLEQRYWRGDHAGACEYGHLIASGLAAIPGSLYNAEARFYYCLASIALDGAQLQPEVEALRGDLARYAASCPENYRHMSALVEAELARSRGDVAQAIHHYDVAIESAAEHGFLKVEALANELAGQFWIERARPAFAAVHYTRARDVYEHWGARAKVRELEIKRRSLGTDDGHAARSTSVATSKLDFETIVKASNAIASEIVLDNLLLKIMDMVVENTGAQAGSIILESNGELLVQASKEHDGPVTVSGGVPLASARGISEGIVKYTMRTAECVVIGEATRHHVFRSDPYVRERRPRSVLCVPIMRADRLVGAIYLENNLVADAFTIDRLDALGILVAQLAISIENAAMFARLASYRDQLEELVAERTSELTAANQQLREQALVRQRMESELRLAQKLQSVGQLAAGVAHEINTPIQFVGNSLEFLGDAFESMLALITAYRAAQVDPSDEIRAAEEEADIDYVVVEAPQAFVSAREGVKRVARIVGAMRAFSHPDQQSQAPSNLNAAIENTLAIAVSEYRPVADIALDLAPLPDVVCHLGEINQVVLNLIVNAAHAIGDAVAGTDGRGTISIATRLDVDDTVVISISDTGCGISAAIRERIFDPFFTTKEVGRGTGQGLALARTAIVDGHGGAIDFEARPGGGTTFHVRLPVNGMAISALTRSAPARPADCGVGGGPTRDGDTVTCP